MRIYGLWEKLTEIIFLKSGMRVTIKPDTQTVDNPIITIPNLAGINQEMVVTQRTQILTNKTIDADANTISNIDNNDIKAAAAIAYSKLNLTTSITNSDINTLAAIDHSKLAAIPSGYILLGNGANTPTATDVTGDIDISNTGVTSINAGVIVDADVNAAAAIAISKLDPLVVGTTAAQILTNKTIDGDNNTLQDISLTSLKTVIGDADKLIRRDATGAIISGNALPNSSNLVTIDATQELTFKTITNATINGGALTGGISGNLSNIMLDGSATLSNQAPLRFREQTGNGTNEVAIQAPAALTANYTLTLPPDDGASGQALTTDGAGVLGWSSVATDALNEQHIKVGNAGTAAAVDTSAVGDILADDTGGLTIKSGVIVNADVNASAGIAYSKLSLTGGIVNADVNASAAIDGSKIVSASASVPGVVTTGAQTFVGVKSFTNGLKVKDTGTGSTTLSHYEEGSFSSLSFVGPVGFSTITINAQIGRFVRIGRLVHWQLRLDFTTGTGTGSGGQILLNGLPYGTTDTLAAFSFVDVLNFSHRTGYANSSSQIVFQTAYSSLAAGTNYVWGLAGTYYT